mgnify:CR=1 FL=1
MKLAKALKLKNKKLKEYKSTLMKVIQHNSYDIDNKPIYNSIDLYNEAVEQLKDYLELKTAIHTSSEPIRFKIFQLGELKSLLNTVNGLDTKSGVYKEGYREITLSTYESSITEEEKNTKVKNLENTIAPAKENKLH